MREWQKALPLQVSACITVCLSVLHAIELVRFSASLFCLEVTESQPSRAQGCGKGSEITGRGRRAYGRSPSHRRPMECSGEGEVGTPHPSEMLALEDTPPRPPPRRRRSCGHEGGKK